MLVAPEQVPSLTALGTEHEPSSAALEQMPFSMYGGFELSP